MVHAPEISILKQVDTPDALVKLRSDGIVHVHYKKNTTLDVDLQLSMRAIFREVTGNRKSGFIFSADEGYTLTKEARENSSRLLKDSPIAAYAIIANNLAYRIVANFYLRVNKPPVPFKLFSGIPEAVKWLRTLHPD